VGVVVSTFSLIVAIHHVSTGQVASLLTMTGHEKLMRKRYDLINAHEPGGQYFAGSCARRAWHAEQHGVLDDEDHLLDRAVKRQINTFNYLKYSSSKRHQYSFVAVMGRQRLICGIP
jgi:hypothetical protein